MSYIQWEQTKSNGTKVAVNRRQLYFLLLKWECSSSHTDSVFVHKLIILAVKRAEFGSDRMSHIIPRDC
jgi:hypothetical protein